MRLYSIHVGGRLYTTCVSASRTPSQPSVESTRPELDQGTRHRSRGMHRNRPVHQWSSSCGVAIQGSPDSHVGCVPVPHPAGAPGPEDFHSLRSRPCFSTEKPSLSHILRRSLLCVCVCVCVRQQQIASANCIASRPRRQPRSCFSELRPLPWRTCLGRHGRCSRLVCGCEASSGRRSTQVRSTLCRTVVRPHRVEVVGTGKLDNYR